MPDAQPELSFLEGKLLPGESILWSGKPFRSRLASSMATLTGSRNTVYVLTNRRAIVARNRSTARLTEFDLREWKPTLRMGKNGMGSILFEVDGVLKTDFGAVIPHLGGEGFRNFYDAEQVYKLILETQREHP